MIHTTSLLLQLLLVSWYFYYAYAGTNSNPYGVSYEPQHTPQQLLHNEHTPMTFSASIDQDTVHAKRYGEYSLLYVKLPHSYHFRESTLRYPSAVGGELLAVYSSQQTISTFRGCNIMDIPFNNNVFPILMIERLFTNQTIRFLQIHIEKSYVKLQATSLTPIHHHHQQQQLPSNHVYDSPKTYQTSDEYHASDSLLSLPLQVPSSSLERSDDEIVVNNSIPIVNPTFQHNKYAQSIHTSRTKKVKRKRKRNIHSIKRKRYTKLNRRIPTSIHYTKNLHPKVKIAQLYHQHVHSKFKSLIINCIIPCIVQIRIYILTILIPYLQYIYTKYSPILIQFIKQIFVTLQQQLCMTFDTTLTWFILFVLTSPRSSSDNSHNNSNIDDYNHHEQTMLQDQPLSLSNNITYRPHREHQSDVVVSHHPTGITKQVSDIDSNNLLIKPQQLRDTIPGSRNHNYNNETEQQSLLVQYDTTTSIRRHNDTRVIPILQPHLYHSTSYNNNYNTSITCLNNINNISTNERATTIVQNNNNYTAIDWNDTIPALILRLLMIATMMYLIVISQ